MLVGDASCRVALVPICRDRRHIPKPNPICFLFLLKLFTWHVLMEKNKWSSELTICVNTKSIARIQKHINYKILCSMINDCKGLIWTNISAHKPNSLFSNLLFNRLLKLLTNFTVHYKTKHGAFMSARGTIQIISVGDPM